MNAGGTRGLSWLTVGLLLAALHAVSHAGVVLGSQSWFYRDFGALGHPTVHYWRETVLAGGLPLWNPLSHCGVPFLAQWGVMACYPGLLFCLLPLPWSLNLFNLAHLALGGAGMWILVRRLGGSGQGGMLAAVVFGMNGLGQACLAWPNYCAALGWLPWVIWLTRCARAEGGRWIAWAALAWAMQLLAGAPEVSLMTGLAVAILLFRDPEWRRRPPWNVGGKEACLRVTTAGWWRGPGRMAGVLGLMAGLTAVQTLPFAGLLLESQRWDGAPDGRWSMGMAGLANLIVPLAGCFQTPEGTWFQADRQFFASTYLGLPAVLLTGLALARPRPGGEARLVGIAVGGLVLALGFGAGVARLADTPLGWLGAIRFPVKFLLLTSFGVAMLAGLGWDRVGALGADRCGRRRLAAVGVAGIAVLALAAVIGSRSPTGSPDPVWISAVGRLVFGVVIAALLWIGRAGGRSGCWPGWLALGVVWLDYRVHLPGLNPTLPAVRLQPGFVRQADAPSSETQRAFITREAEARLLRSETGSFETDYLGRRLAHWSHLNLLEGVAKVNGAATLRLRWQDEIERALYAGTAPSEGFLDFLGVAWRSAETNPTAWVARASAGPLVTAGQNPVWLPDDHTLAAAVDPAFDPRREVILRERDRPDDESHRAAEAGVEIVRSSARRRVCRVEAAAPTWLVVAQTWDRGWRARVNGEAAPVLRANHAFQAVPLPAGASEVVLEYRDRWFRMGAWITGLTWLLLGGWMWGGARFGGPESRGSGRW